MQCTAVGNTLVVRRHRGGVEGVIHVGSVGPLREEQGAAERAHHDGDDPPEHGLGEDLAVDAAGSLQEGHTGGSSDLWLVSKNKQQQAATTM